MLQGILAWKKTSALYVAITLEDITLHLDQKACVIQPIETRRTIIF